MIMSNIDNHEVRRQIEEGWQSARRGELVDGDEVFDRVDAESRSAGALSRPLTGTPLLGDFRYARHARQIAALEERGGGAQIQIETHGERLAAGELDGLADLARTGDPFELLTGASGGGLIGLLEQMEGRPQAFAAGEPEVGIAEAHTQLSLMRTAAVPGECALR